MKTVWFAASAAIAALAATSGLAQSTIYKHVDGSGRITYSNKPMKGGVVLELDPITTLPTPAAVQAAASARTPTAAKLVVTQKPAEMQPVAAIITPLPRTTLAAAEPAALKARADGKPRAEDKRRRELLEEIARAEQELSSARTALTQEQQNPQLIAAVRVAQQASEPSASQLAQFRENIERASGRIRGLQATVAEHEQVVDSLRKELEGLMP
jgi:hypothetical protein